MAAYNYLPIFQDAEYQSVLESHLPSLINTFRPDLVIYDAGVDPHERDELGKLNLTDQGHRLLNDLSSKWQINSPFIL